MSIIIQAFFDYVCPYCYLGEVVLKRAAAATGVEIIRRAYQLRESGPAKLDPRGDQLNTTWENSIYPLAKRLGIEMHQPSRLPLTRLAHEAAAWARQHGRFEQFHTTLFKSFFLEDKDLSELSVLKEVAWQSGLNPNELEQALTERRMAEEVDEDLLIGRTYGINSVPTFVIAGHLLRGVQEEAVLINAIELGSTGKFQAETRKLPYLPIGISKWQKPDNSE